MITNSKVPQIRFKGFSGEWETKELGDIGSVAMNKRIFKSQTTEKGDIPFYKIGTFGGKADAFISKQLFEDYKSKYPYPKQGDLLISASGSIGRIVEYTGKDEYFQDSNIVWLKHENQLENSFLKQFYNIVKWSGLEGSTIQRLYNKNILETLISFPKQRNEQAKIGDYFQQLDKLIEYKEKKHQKLKQFKKAMLSKMFPKNGADTPEIRFKGFSGKWEEKKLGDIFNYERPDNYIVKSTEYSNENKTPVLTANKAFILGYTNELNTFNKPSIIFDDFTLDFKFVDFSYMVKSSALKILTINDEKKDSLIFIYYLLHTIKIEIMGHARHYIGVVQPTNVFVPKIEEQAKIGNYFQKLDNQIELQQKELEKLKNIKKALLTKMFV